MSNVRQLFDSTDVDEVILRLEGKIDALQHGEGGGTSGGMEARIARLESDMEHVKRGVDQLRSDVSGVKKDTADLTVNFARFDERSKHFPTKGFIFTTAAGLLGAGGALVALIFRFVPHAG